MKYHFSAPHINAPQIARCVFIASPRINLILEIVTAFQIAIEFPNRIRLSKHIRCTYEQASKLNLISIFFNLFLRTVVPPNRDESQERPQTARFYFPRYYRGQSIEYMKATAGLATYGLLDAASDIIVRGFTISSYNRYDLCALLENERYFSTRVLVANKTAVLSVFSL